MPSRLSRLAASLPWNHLQPAPKPQRHLLWRPTRHSWPATQQATRTRAVPSVGASLGLSKLQLDRGSTPPHSAPVPVLLVLPASLALPLACVALGRAAGSLVPALAFTVSRAARVGVGRARGGAGAGGGGGGGAARVGVARPLGRAVPVAVAASVPGPPVAVSVLVPGTVPVPVPVPVSDASLAFAVAVPVAP